MRCLFGFVFVCALGAISVVGCSEAGRPPECQIDEDCDDQNECTVSFCDAGGSCYRDSSELNGNPCDLNGAPGVCVGGVCAECQSDKDCDDQNECTHEWCVFPDAGPTSCDTFVLLEFPCDLDGLVGICVPGDECIEDGLCGDLDCDDNNECTYDYCREAGGV
jgi:hypothetical protein